ncbi:activating signal cointegrator 1 complex subunit 1 [Lucilia sericata]|uniref:activating signal cointegrator 1 complex subunit 1 n=1 Tax=Lucilia sericata TaxID=13632 RepID=UPI0018A8429C|nr:activating signal cointegrator 1 complex subunit 1 [Lucilia sericata]
MSREVLAPPLMRMGPNRCYRVNLIHEDFSSQYGASLGSQQQAQAASKTYAEEDLYGEDYNDELDAEVDCQIEETQNGMFKLPIHVASSFYGGIIGHKGSTKRRIETEAQCDITIPQRNATQKQSNSKIIIKAKTRNNVLSARRKIQLLLTSLRKRMAPTHFYGIALNFGEIQEKFIDLRKQIMSAEIAGIEESIFQSENSIHLTFGTCVLMDEVERTRAMEILQSCREFLTDLKPPFTVRVSGLEIMNDDPSSVRVLYALVESPELQIFADRCFQRFNQSGFGFDDFDRGNVKLHMTVMNNRYRNSDAKSFDAREILKRWSNFDFGTAQCNELLLCVIGGSAKDTSVFYKITDSMKF